MAEKLLRGKAKKEALPFQGTPLFHDLKALSE
jgi:hypothetical protein